MLNIVVIPDDSCHSTSTTRTPLALPFTGSTYELARRAALCRRQQVDHLRGGDDLAALGDPDHARGDIDGITEEIGLVLEGRPEVEADLSWELVWPRGPARGAMRSILRWMSMAAA